MAHRPDLRGADRIREVFARVRAGDVSVADLYAADARLSHGAGSPVRGREDIRDFYGRTIGALAPDPRVEAILEAPPLYVAVVEAATSRGSRRVIDLFQLEDGEIQSLEIYSQRPVPSSRHRDAEAGWVDLEAIKQLKARYLRFIDTKNWEGFRDLFTEDCKHYLPQESEVPYMGNDQYFATMETMLAGGTTTHHGHMPEITFVGDREAEGVWSMFDYVQVEGPAGRISIKGYGYYYETYRKGPDGRWRISSKRNERLRLDEVPWTLPNGPEETNQ